MKSIEKITWNIKWKWQDIWIGLFFDYNKAIFSDKIRSLDLYLCLVPFIPIHIKILFKVEIE